MNAHQRRIARRYRARVSKEHGLREYQAEMLRMMRARVAGKRHEAIIAAPRRPGWTLTRQLMGERLRQQRAGRTAPAVTIIDEAHIIDPPGHQFEEFQTIGGDTVRVAVSLDRFDPPVRFPGWTTGE